MCVCVNQCKGSIAVERGRRMMGVKDCCRQSTLLTQSLTALATATAHSRRSTSPDPDTHVHMYTLTHTHTRTPVPPSRCDAKTKECIKKCKSKALGAVASTSTGTFRAHSPQRAAHKPTSNAVEHPEPLIKLIILLSFL